MRDHVDTAIFSTDWRTHELRPSGHANGGEQLGAQVALRSCSSHLWKNWACSLPPASSTNWAASSVVGLAERLLIVSGLV
jgi:hypothetical protein